MAKRARHKRRSATRRRATGRSGGAETSRSASPEGNGGEDGVPGEAAHRPGNDAAPLPVCPLCERPIPPHAKQSLHHLVPKLRGGRHGPTVLVHQICHNEIHSVLTETELARGYNTPEALRAHPALARFAAWVAKKDPAFHSRTVGNKRRR